MDNLDSAATWDRYADPQPGTQITTGTSDDNVVVAVRGELDLASAPAFLERARALLDRPVETLTIDLANVTFIDSAGINALNQLRLLTEARAIPFALAAVPRCAQRVLEITNMDGFFTYR